MYTEFMVDAHRTSDGLVGTYTSVAFFNILSSSFLLYLLCMICYFHLIVIIFVYLRYTPTVNMLCHLSSLQPPQAFKLAFK